MYVENPEVEFGLPQAHGVRAETIRGRFEAEEPIDVIAEDFGLSSDDVQHGIQYELLAAASRLTFFCDRNLGRRVPAALRTSGWVVEIHDDHFAQDTKDVDLLPAVAERNWVFVTQDSMIRYRSAETRAWREAGLRVFVVVTANLKAEETAGILEKARPRIDEIAASEQPPFIDRVGKDGSVRRVD